MCLNGHFWETKILRSKTIEDEFFTRNPSHSFISSSRKNIWIALIKSKDSAASYKACWRFLEKRKHFISIESWGEGWWWWVERDLIILASLQFQPLPKNLLRRKSKVWSLVWTSISNVLYITYYFTTCYIKVDKISCNKLQKWKTCFSSDNETNTAVTIRRASIHWKLQSSFSGWKKPSLLYWHVSPKS